MSPGVSVVIAVERGDDLKRCLAGLARQAPGTSGVEVVAACIGGRSAGGHAAWPSGLPVRLLEAIDGPRGTVWNAAAAVALGEILIFMRADAEPYPHLVARHLEAHAGDRPAAAVGRVAEADEEESATPARAAVGTGANMLGECERATLSVRRKDFDRVGGFSNDLRWGAEIELAHRLTTQGMGLHRIPNSVARSRPLTLRAAAVARVSAGRGSVELYRHTPALLPFLELGAFHFAGPSALRLRRVLLALGGPPLPEVPGGLLRRGKWRDRWRQFAHDYHFWRGAMDAIPERAMRRALVRAPVILLYHAVARPKEASGWYIVPVRRFARQMVWLAARRYRILSLGELLEYRRRFELVPARSVVITFDDGYADNYELAYPILRRQGFRAAFFLVSGRIGGRNDWDTRGELAGRPIVSWPAARELVAGGMEIGAHTRRHPALPELSPVELVEEVGGGRRDLEAGLGQPVHIFAYPFGRLDEATTAAVAEAGFVGACCSRSGVNDPGVPVLLLRRVEVRGLDSLLHFALAVHRGRAVRRRRPA